MFSTKPYPDQVTLITNLQAKRIKLKDLYRIKDPEVKRKRAKPKSKINFPTEGHKEMFERMSPEMKRLLL